MYRLTNLSVSALLLMGLSASTAQAATITATGCSQANVSSALSSAVDGDTVRIPACTGSWSSAVTVSNKAIRIEGAGIDQTIISLGGGGFLTLTGSSTGNNVASIGNMTLTGTGSDGFIDIKSAYRFRLHHVKIGDIANRAIVVTGSSGVIDHMTFTTNNGYNAIQVLGGNTTPTGRWNQPMTFGSVDQVYIEDSTFTATNCITSLGTFDGFNGSRMVFRHNTVVNWSGYVHGYDSAPESALQWEIYDNSFSMAKSGCAIPRMLFMRGGTGYVFNNTMHLADAYNLYAPAFLDLYYYRSEQSQQGSICNGSASVDGNQAGKNGYLCFQQPGSGGAGKNVSVPIYEYNNVGTGNMTQNLTIRSESSHVVSGRDFFLDTPKPGYTPYTYPHPLTSGSAPSGPTAPSNLRIISQ